MKRELKKQLNLEFIRFSRSGQDIVSYCKEHDVPYLEFVEVVNEWNRRYGIPLVEKCMNRVEVAGKWAEHNKYFPSTAERRFKELVIEPDVRKCRSHTRFPLDPSILVELGAPRPETIIREATVTFPSGVELTFSDASIQSLILTIVLYEEFDFRANQ